MKEQKKKVGHISFESLEILLKKCQDGTVSEILDDWKWVFSYSKKYTWAIVISTIIGLLVSTMGIISSIAGKYLLDVVINGEKGHIAILLVLMGSSAVLSIILGNWIGRFNLKLNIKINQDIQSDLFEKIMDADWIALSQYSSGDLVNHFNYDVSTISNNTISWIPMMIIAIYNFVATFLVMLHYDILMAVMAIAGAPFTLFISAIALKKRKAYGMRLREMSSSRMSFEVEAFYNYDTIKSFGITKKYSKKLGEWQEKSRNLMLDYNLFDIKMNYMKAAANALVQGGAFCYCLWRIWTRNMTFGTMQLFLTQRNKLTSAFSNVTGVLPTFINTSIAVSRIRKLMELPREVHLIKSRELDETAKAGFEVLMQDVRFSYVEGKDIVSKSSFTANPGEIVALIGPSGEGKTTMIRLILGLICPKEGRVLLRAMDGKEVDMNADTRHLFSYVPQGNTIFSGTIADNLRLINEKATDEEIRKALESACAWEFVSEMPKGIYSEIGEKGKGLSEGQAQRIAIARAILCGAPILLLDEATSALDVATERKLLRNIMKQHPNKTCIVTTHRPSVLNMCQRVYRVMDTQVTELDEEDSSRMAMDF